MYMYFHDVHVTECERSLGYAWDQNGGFFRNIFVVKYLRLFLFTPQPPPNHPPPLSTPHTLLHFSSGRSVYARTCTSRDKKKEVERTEGRRRKRRRNVSIDSTWSTRASFLIFQWGSSALEIYPSLSLFILSRLSSDSVKPYRNFIPLLPVSTARLSIYLHIFVIFRDVNPRSLLPPIPSSSSRTVSLSLFFLLSRCALLSNSRSNPASTISSLLASCFFFLFVTF